MSEPETSKVKSKKKQIPRNEGLEAALLPEDLTAEQVQTRLKSERVQEALAALPGWRLQQHDGETLSRVREFSRPQAAKAYAAYVLELAAVFHQPIHLQMANKQLVITLRGYSQRSRQDGITEAMLHLASNLG